MVALGLFSGIAFSASYQLVARFANKNVIALGLGCFRQRTAGAAAASWP